MTDMGKFERRVIVVLANTGSEKVKNTLLRHETASSLKWECHHSLEMVESDWHAPTTNSEVR